MNIANTSINQEALTDITILLFNKQLTSSFSIFRINSSACHQKSKVCNLFGMKKEFLEFKLPKN